MKRSDMDQSFVPPLTLTCVSALIAGLVPATLAQESLQTIERAPANQFETEKQNTLAKFLEAGPISVRPHLYADSYYDSNVTLGQGATKLEDWIWRIAPGAQFGIGEFRGDKGNFVALDYTLNGKIYTKHDEFNSVDHYVTMSGGWKLAKLTLGLSQTYEIDHGKHVEAGAFVVQEDYITLLTSKYEISDKTSVELNARQFLVDSQEQLVPSGTVHLNTINEWTVEGWGNYKVTEKVTAGVGGTLGWRDIRSYDGNPSPNQTYQQGLVRGTYLATEKLSLTGSAGLQVSQFQDNGDKGPTFVFNLAGSWHPMENTYLAAEAYRRDVPSFVFSGQNYTLTGLRTSVKQVLLEKYAATLATGYENSDYTKVAGGGGPDRADDYFWIRPGFDYTINERWVIGAFYQYRTKNSNQDVFDYTAHQVGFYSNYQF